jgi:hypothetical protein
LDPSRPSRILPAYDSGDHLHPNGAGDTASAEAIPLSIFGARWARTANGTEGAALAGRVAAG